MRRRTRDWDEATRFTAGELSLIRSTRLDARRIEDAAAATLGSLH